MYYREDLLKDSLNPGYPKETGEKSLGTWCALMSGADLSQEQTPTEVDEKIFVMRPFVFACAKVSLQSDARSCQIRSLDSGKEAGSR